MLSPPYNDNIFSWQKRILQKYQKTFKNQTRKKNNKKNQTNDTLQYKHSLKFISLTLDYRDIFLHIQDLQLERCLTYMVVASLSSVEPLSAALVSSSVRLPLASCIYTSRTVCSEVIKYLRLLVFCCIYIQVYYNYLF